MKKYISYIVLTFIFFACNAKQKIKVTPNNSLIKYVGRINFADPDSPILYWSASEIEICFKGTEVTATLDDETGLNYFNVVIDKDSLHPLKMDKGLKTYILAKNLNANKTHTLELIKRNEFKTGQTAFKGFTINNGSLLTIPKNSGRLIEFFGNSITSGYAIDSKDGNNPDSIYTNSYDTYAALTARYFDADMHATVREGTGITVSWHKYIMPEIYNRLNPHDSTSIWNFNRATPNLVVINLFQNDSWLINKPKYPEYIRRFGNTHPTKDFMIKAYANFVKSIRKAYPKTPIICTLGSMDAVKKGSVWPSYIKEAIGSLNDSNIYIHFFKYINKNGHPRVEDDKKMAQSLISFIENNLNWKK